MKRHEYLILVFFSCSSSCQLFLISVFAQSNRIKKNSEQIEFERFSLTSRDAKKLVMPMRARFILRSRRDVSRSLILATRAQVF